MRYDSSCIPAAFRLVVEVCILPITLHMVRASAVLGVDKLDLVVNREVVISNLPDSVVSSSPILLLCLAARTAVISGAVWQHSVAVPPTGRLSSLASPLRSLRRPIAPSPPNQQNKLSSIATVTPSPPMVTGFATKCSAQTSRQKFFQPTAVCLASLISWWREV